MRDEDVQAADSPARGAESSQLGTLNSQLTDEAGLSERVAPSTPRAGEKTYRVKAIWRTLQGEGVWAGRAAVFIRFVGFNLWSGYETDRQRDAERSGADCPLWCDTEFTKEGSVRLTAEDLAAEAARAGDAVRFCVLTGGEPLLQADRQLVQALRAEGFEIAVETNGTQRLADAFGVETDWPDWIVCSPKLPEERLVLEACDELKLVVPDYLPSAYRQLEARVREHGGRRALWVQPEDGPRVAEVTRLAVELAMGDPRWRVSVQTHKVLGVD
ncbi:MAG: radical SAM protein [Bacteroidota bacterium]